MILRICLTGEQRKRYDTRKIHFNGVGNVYSTINFLIFGSQSMRDLYEGKGSFMTAGDYLINYRICTVSMCDIQEMMF